MPTSTSQTWNRPWSKLLQGINWKGNLSSEPDSTLDESILLMPESPPVILPEKPLQAGFAGLLRAIPWKGRKPFIPQNRIKEVLS